ncbi:MAG: serine O-acetyltransferase [Lachnospiraceae bacterium]|nr:serine O-acetyltransferase [Lachnospiraceae bacterium]
MDLFSKPDKEEVQELVTSLFRIIYPGFFRDRSYKIYNPMNSFAVTIEDTFYHLNKQVYLALGFRKNSEEISSEEERKETSYRICKNFFDRVPLIREYIETDLLATFDGDPAAGSLEEIILAYPGLMAITVYRIAHELYKEDVPVLPRLMTEYAHSLTGIDIHPGATIGKYFFIDHGTGIVIGETSIIGQNVKIYQGVTIGALSTRGGQKLSGKKRHPTICDNVTIYANASILGGDTVIGENTVIGGNSFITCSIDANTRVSMKNLEMEYKNGDHEGKSEEVRQSDEWYYMI